MKKRENWALGLSAIALVISLISVCIAVFRSKPIEIEWASLLIAILSVLVTVLITWQIYNYIHFHAEIHQKGSIIVDEKVNGMLHDEKVNGMLHAIKGYAIGHFCTALFCKGDEKSLDEAFEALTEVCKSNGVDTSGEINDFVIRRILQIIQDIKSSNNGQLRILDGRKNHYLSILRQIRHEDKDDIIQDIKNGIPENSIVT